MDENPFGIGLPDITVDFGALADQVAALGPLTVVLMALTGGVLAAWSLIAIARANAGQRAGESLRAPLVMLLIGGLLTTSAVLLEIGSGTIGATSTAAEEARASVLGGEALAADVFKEHDAKLAQAARFGLTVVAIVGLMGFFKGWMMMNALGRGRAPPGAAAGKAMTLVFGGLAAINIPWTITAIANTFGVAISF